MWYLISDGHNQSVNIQLGAINTIGGGAGPSEFPNYPINAILENYTGIPYFIFCYSAEANTKLRSEAKYYLGKFLDKATKIIMSQ